MPQAEAASPLFTFMPERMPTITLPLILRLPLFRRMAQPLAAFAPLASIVSACSSPLPVIVKSPLLCTATSEAEALPVLIRELAVSPASTIVIGPSGSTSAEPLPPWRTAQQSVSVPPEAPEAAGSQSA